MDNAKEGYFGLPDDLFEAVVAFLVGVAGGGTAAAAPALAALASLAKEEHASAATLKEPRVIDVVFKAIELRDDLAALQTIGAAGLSAALTAFAGKLDKLTDFWNGK